MKKIWPLVLQLLIWLDIVCFGVVMSMTDSISETNETGMMIMFRLIIFCVAFLLIGLPLGIIGLLQTRRKPEAIRCVTLTYWLSLINICIGSLAVLALVWTIINAAMGKI